MPTRDTSETPRRRRAALEGEGSRSADAAYRKGLRKFIDAGRVEPAAESARGASAAPLPPWWTDSHAAAWKRAEAALDLEPSTLILDEQHAREVLRYGVGAASFFRDLPEWNDRLEHLLREEWRELGTGIDWEQAEPVVRRGWEWGRKDMIDSKERHHG
jgi:hypothetical protein